MLNYNKQSFSIMYCDIVYLREEGGGRRSKTGEEGEGGGADARAGACLVHPCKVTPSPPIKSFPIKGP